MNGGSGTGESPAPDGTTISRPSASIASPGPTLTSPFPSTVTSSPATTPAPIAAHAVRAVAARW